MKIRNASINDVKIDESERRISTGDRLDRFSTGTFLR
jgi:nuclear transport factor 2 (NTF2) superfamily protein